MEQLYEKLKSVQPNMLLTLWLDSTTSSIASWIAGDARFVFVVLGMSFVGVLYTPKRLGNVSLAVFSLYSSSSL